MRLTGLLLGRRLATREAGTRRIGALEGVPAMGLDAIGSSAYGPEAALAVMIPLGTLGLAWFGTVMLPIVALLVILTVSYWQTLRAYPHSGGAYRVAQRNLGPGAGLVAAAALMIDYVLNVAVGISAGVAALVSAMPALHAHMLGLCLAILGFVTLINLRGTRESGRVLALPTYLLVLCLGGVLAVGAWRALDAGGHPQPVVVPPALPAAVEAAGLWLLLRAFAAGCTAMTGIEAVSNGMGAFREPSLRYGHRTLLAIAVILGLLLVGVACLAPAYGIGAMDQTRAGYRSVLSQLVAAVAGEGVLYHTTLGALLCVLALSANTSFVAFPRLCRAVAEDGYLPRPFATAGRRLVYSSGLLSLSACAAALLVAFDGITDRLIPLFAVGAFVGFSMSQLAMARHWFDTARLATGAERAAHRTRLAINAGGAAATLTALAVIVIAKFADGAWITLFAIPALIVALRAVHRYYDALGRRLASETLTVAPDPTPPVVLVALEDWNALARRAVEFALSISPDVIAVHLTELSAPDAGAHARHLRVRWRRDVVEPARGSGGAPPRLILLRAPFRTIHEPLLQLARRLERVFAGRRIVVLVPELIKHRWYQHLLHTHRARRLRTQLLRHGRSRLAVMTLPWDAAPDAAGSPAAEPAPRRPSRPR